MAKAHQEQEQHNGPDFFGENGDLASSIGYQCVFVEFISQVQRRRTDLIPADMDVVAEYDIGCYFRRGSDTRALNIKVPGHIINSINQWRTIEMERCRRPRLSMMLHYSDVLLMLDTFLQYLATL